MYSNTTAELSLNTPSKCITSIPNDTSNHRFIVGTCSLSPSTPSASNSIYLLRYHEEMNELAVDAQLDFDNDENSPSFYDSSNNSNGNSSSGQMWCLSSCPLDKQLIVACRDNGLDGSVETALWRIPERALKEDEIDYYPDDMVDLDSSNMNSNNNGLTSGAGGGVGSNLMSGQGGGFQRNMSSDVNESMEKVDIFDHTSAATGAYDDRNSNSSSSSSSILKGRVSDMTWNPSCLPHFDDVGSSNSDISTTGTSGINFLTANHAIDGNPTIYTWDISTSSTTLINKISIPSLSSSSFQKVPNAPKLSWDPHNTNLCAITSGLNVAVVDFRTGDVVSGLKHCHKFGVTDVDYNPNKPNILSTSGQDALVKFWDLRYSSTTSTTMSRQQPLRILRGGHTHWTTKVKYNSFHDQLLLSSGTDGMVNLWRVSSISSAPLLDLGSTTGEGMIGDDDMEGIDPERDFKLHSTLSGFDDEDEEKINIALNTPSNDNDDDDGIGLGGNKNETSFSDDATDGGNTPDVRVTKMEMREAVYDLDWSAADPWIYVTLGFDGNVVLNYVPSKEKYKILL